MSSDQSANFTTLSEAIKSDDFDKAVNVCNEILSKIPDDKDAWKCKAVAMMQQGKFEDVLKTIQSAPGSVDLSYEKAYALYKLKRYDECLKTASLPPLLQAQALYKKGSYGESASLYSQLYRQDSGNSELCTNVLASLTQCGRRQEAISFYSEHNKGEDNTYELHYNAALAADETSVARRLLERAKEGCKEGRAADEEQVWQDESVMEAQEGYLSQQEGKREDASKRYQRILDHKSSDKGAMAVAASNMVALQEHHGLYDALKRLEKARAPDVYDTLTLEQRENVTFNYAVVLLRLNRHDQCQKVLDELIKEFPKSSGPGELRASLLVAEKKYPEAIALLEDGLKKKGGADDQLVRAIAQLYVSSHNWSKALEWLQRLAAPLRRDAVISVLSVCRAWTNEDINNTNNKTIAVAALREVLGKAASNDDRLDILLLAAELKQALGEFKGAAEDFKQVLKLKPGLSQALVGYVVCASRFDPAAADAMAESLGGGSAGLSGIDVEELEAKLLAGGTAMDIDPKKSVEGLDVSGAAAADEPTKRKRPKRKNKKKKKLPKDLDKPIDPERWLPMKKRSYYIAPVKKGKSTKGKKRIGGAGGHQGVAISGDQEKELDASLKKATAAAAAASSPPPKKGGGGKKKPGRK